MGQVGVGSGATAGADVSLGLFGQGLYKVRGHSSFLNLLKRLPKLDKLLRQILLAVMNNPIIYADTFPCDVPRDTTWWTTATHCYRRLPEKTDTCPSCDVTQDVLYCVSALEKSEENGLTKVTLVTRQKKMCYQCLTFSFTDLDGMIVFKQDPRDIVARFYPVVVNRFRSVKSARN